MFLPVFVHLMQISVTFISLFDLSGVTIFRDVILFILYVIKPYPILNVFSNVKFQYITFPPYLLFQKYILCNIYFPAKEKNGRLAQKHVITNLITLFRLLCVIDVFHFSIITSIQTFQKKKRRNYKRWRLLNPRFAQILTKTNYHSFVL